MTEVFIVMSDFETEFSGREYTVNGVYSTLEQAKKRMNEIFINEFSISLANGETPREIEGDENRVFISYDNHNWFEVSIFNKEVDK